LSGASLPVASSVRVPPGLCPLYFFFWPDGTLTTDSAFFESGLRRIHECDSTCFLFGFLWGYP
jgi:hypothetical protein